MPLVRCALLAAAAFGLLLVAWRAPIASAEEAPAPPALVSPFPEDQSWLITCGYTLPEESEGCGHSGSQWNWYALDFQHIAGPEAANGQPVRAAADGRVGRAGWSEGLGWHVFIDHGAGYTTVYGHMGRPPVVQEGDDVAAGSTIGQVGCTGNCTGPHIHFALWQDGVSVPPESICGVQDLSDGQVLSGCGTSVNISTEPLAPGVVDFDGDGRHDLAFLYEPPGDAAHIDIVSPFGASFDMTGHEGWWQAEQGQTFQAVADALAGDFDGDGRSDLALLINDQDCLAWLPVLLAEERRFTAPELGGWWTGSTYCPRAAGAGDMDGDGLADVGLLSEPDTGSARIDVLRSDGERLVADPESWWQSDEWVGPLTDLLPGDFDGDGLTDLVALSTDGSCASYIQVFLSTGQAFVLGETELWWNFSIRCSSAETRTALGDFDGDGQTDDLAFFYDDGSGVHRVRVLRFEDESFVQGRESLWWEEEPSSTLTDARALMPGDFNDDGRTDLAVLSDDGECSTRVVMLASQGDGFEAADWWTGDSYCAGRVRHAAP